MNENEYEQKDKRWLRDADGWYWITELYQNGKRIGLTGNYYDLDEREAERPE